MCTARKPSGHSTQRRARWHNYKAPGWYMITLTKNRPTPDLAIVGQVGSSVCATVTPTGLVALEAIKGMASLNEALHTSNIVVMPDHVHFLLHVSARLPKTLGEFIGALKGSCTRRLDRAVPFFAEGWHDRIIMDVGQIDVIKAYIADNPRRWWIKRTNPQLFSTPHAVVIDGEEWCALGNIFLLGDSDLQSVHISSRYTSEYLRALKLKWLWTIENGGVLAGAFISEGERRVRDYAMAHGARLIHLIDHPIDGRYKPWGRMFELCHEGRLLVIAPARHFADGTTQRAKFQRLNRIADLLAAGAFTLPP